MALLEAPKLLQFKAGGCARRHLTNHSSRHRFAARLNSGVRPVKDSQHKRPLILGFALACVLPPLGAVSLAGHWLSVADLAPYFVLLAFSAPGVLVLGVPFVLLLRSCYWLSWGTVLITSVVTGNLYYQILGIFLSTGFEIRYLVEGSIFGVLAGLGFCIGAWPNKLFKPTPLRGAA